MGGGKGGVSINNNNMEENSGENRGLSFKAGNERKIKTRLGFEKDKILK